MAVKPESRMVTVKAVGTGGMNTLDDSSVIADIELADAQNVVSRDGYLAPRTGTSLLYEKPSGESGSALQLLTARTSDGIEYTVAIYDNHFYLWHPDTEEWLRINQTFTPTETTRRYGYVNWNNGRGDDRLYLSNGKDSNIRWDVCVTTASGAQTAGAATFTVADGSRFPNTGTLVISGVSSVFTEAYTSRAGNVFTLTNTLNQNVSDGASVASDMIEKASMAKGKHLGKYNQRLVIANYYGGETVLQVSVQNDPEDFTIASNISGATTETIADGNGEITGLHDFGQFLVVEKEDSIHSFSLTISDDVGSKLAVIKPMISGESVGPIDSGGTIKVLGTLYYPTTSNGFLSLTPSGTGDSVSVKMDILSQKIANYVKNKTDLSEARAGAVDNKIIWAVTPTGGSTNTIVLEYDLQRSSWTKHSGLNVKDFAVKQGDLLYLDGATGHVYQVFDGSYNDNNEAYSCSAHLKRFDFGEAGMPKTADSMYVQGFMTTASEFFIDVFYDENGSLGKQTYQINKDTEGLVFSDPVTGAMGEFIMGNPVLGASSLSGIGNLQVFRCFLALRTDLQHYTVQPRVYSNKAAFYAVAAVGFNPVIEPIIPQSAMVQPIDV